MNAVPPLVWLLIGYVYITGSSSGLYRNVFGLFIGILLLNFFATLQNDVEDIGIDMDSGRSSALIKEEISARKLRLIYLLFLITALLLPLINNQHSYTIWLAGYAAVIYTYNKKPLILSRKPISSILILGLCFSALPFLFGIYAAEGHISLKSIIILLGGLLLRCSISSLKDFKDYDADKEHHKLTFLVRYGDHKLIYLSNLSYTIGVILILTTLYTSDTANKLPIVTISLLAIFILWMRSSLRTGQRNYTHNNVVFHNILLPMVILELGILLCFYMP